MAGLDSEELMNVEKVVEELATLPPEAQQQVMDFIALLKVRYSLTKDIPEIQEIDWNNELFVGMWQDREDMKDSSKWVSSLRQREWCILSP